MRSLAIRVLVRSLAIVVTVHSPSWSLFTRHRDHCSLAIVVTVHSPSWSLFTRHRGHCSLAIVVTRHRGGRSLAIMVTRHQGCRSLATRVVVHSLAIRVVVRSLVLEKNQFRQLLSYIRSNCLFLFTLAKVVQTYFREALSDCFDKCVDVVVFHRSVKHVVIQSREKWRSLRVGQHSGGDRRQDSCTLWKNTPRRPKHELDTFLGLQTDSRNTRGWLLQTARDLNTTKL